MLHDNPQALMQTDTAQFGTFSVNSHQAVSQSTIETVCPREDMLHTSDIQDKINKNKTYYSSVLTSH